MKDANEPAPPAALTAALMRPQLSLRGEINDQLYEGFREQLTKALETDGPLVLEISTSGGDADLGRQVAEDVRLLRDKLGRDLWVLGKTTVYSAGVTVLAAFARERRWLTRDTMLLIHERQLTRDLHLDGALGLCRRLLTDQLAVIESGLALERQGFEDLARGSRLTADAVADRARTNWHCSAKEALDLGLVEGLI